MTTPPTNSPIASSFALIVEAESQEDATFKCAECNDIMDHFAQEFTLFRQDEQLWSLGFYVCRVCGAHKVKKFPRNV